MKYTKPEMRISAFDADDMITTSGFGNVEDELKKSGKIKLDGKNGLSDTSLFSFNW